jgi:hypothetical protein
MPRKNKKDKCELCGKENSILAFHHLVPKKLHKKTAITTLFLDVDLNSYGVMVCAPCHKMIHKKINHFDLATKYYSLEKLKNHFQLSRFIAFQQKSHKNKRVK